MTDRVVIEIQITARERKCSNEMGETRLIVLFSFLPFCHHVCEKNEENSCSTNPIIINPGRRKVNCECREVPLSLGAVQHI